MTKPDRELPTVSVIMAAFNEQENIQRAIISLQSQTYADWELIVVDDGSLDRTPKLIAELARGDSRIKGIFKGANSGLPDSLNTALRKARGRFIARADADDVNLPDRLERQISYLEMNPSVDVVGGGALLMNSRGEAVRVALMPNAHEDLALQPILKTPFFHPTVMMRKEFFSRVGPYSLDFPRAEDKELWLRGLRCGCRYANLNTPLIQYFTNDYKRSWRAIWQNSLSRARLAMRYRMPLGLFWAMTALLNATLIKLRIRRPRLMKRVK